MGDPGAAQVREQQLYRLTGCVITCSRIVYAAVALKHEVPETKNVYGGLVAEDIELLERHPPEGRAVRRGFCVDELTQPRHVMEQRFRDHAVAKHTGTESFRRASYLAGKIGKPDWLGVIGCSVHRGGNEP